METNKIHNISAKKGFEQCDNKSIDCIVTSPPYWQKRDYNVKNQLGQEKTPDEFIDKLVDIFRVARPKLKDSATVWINIADTYSGSGNGWSKNGYSGGKMNELPLKNRNERQPEISVPSGSQIGIPYRFAIRMIQDGWILKNTIIWQKPNATPGGAADKRKFTNDYEFLFFFVKTNKYYFEKQTEPLKESSYARAQRNNYSVKSNTNVYKGFNSDNNNKYFEKIRSGKITDKNKRAVWTIATKSFHGAHFAIHPEDLIKTPISAGCPENGLVCDPFMGSGTTAKVAMDHGRNYIGFEINPDYIKIANNQRLNGLDIISNLIKQELKYIKHKTH